MSVPLLLPEMVFPNVPETRLRDVERFLSKVLILDSGCYEWQGYLNKTSRRLPHGRFKICGGHAYVHRLSLAWSMGLALDVDLPEGVVRHKCNYSLCVCPDHLLLGTVAENNQDMIDSGRHVAPKGIHNGNGRFTDDEIAAMRASAGESTPKELAARFNCSIGYVREVLSGRKRKP